MRIICNLIFLILAIITDEDLNSTASTPMTKAEQEWTEQSFSYMMSMMAGFIAVYLLTLYDSRQSLWFGLKIIIFVIYECFFLFLFSYHYVKGIHMKYGP